MHTLVWLFYVRLNGYDNGENDQFIKLNKNNIEKNKITKRAQNYPDNYLLIPQCLRIKKYNKKIIVDTKNEYLKGVERMNSKLIKISLLLISAAVFVGAGCGPMDINDQVNAQEGNMASDGQNMQEQKGAEAQAPAMDEAKAPAQAAPAQAAPAQAGGCPAGGCPTGGCATGNCEIAPDPNTEREVQMPDQVVVEPTQITPTAEEQVATHTVRHRTTRHVYKPHERHHTVTKVDNTVNEHYLTIVNHPTTKRINSIIRTGSSTDVKMPDQVIEAPLVDQGCGGVEPAPVVQPVVQPVVVRPVPVLPAYRSFYGYGWRGMYRGF